MEELLRQELLAQTKQALDADDWNAVVRLWKPWVEQGDADAEYQLAFNYLWCTPCDDEATCDQMKELLIRAAAKNHPDAIWFLATRALGARETSPEFERDLLRAGELGSIHAQRQLGVMYATGERSGPKDLAGFKPAPPADRATVIRSVTFDLTGLPPSPEEITAFVADKSPHAWEKWRLIRAMPGVLSFSRRGPDVESTGV